MKLNNRAILRPPTEVEKPDVCAVHCEQNQADFLRELDDETERAAFAAKSRKMVVMGPVVRVEESEKGSLAEAELVMDLKEEDWREDEEFATPGDRRLEKAVDYILSYFYGATYGQGTPLVEKTKSRIAKKLREMLMLDRLEDADADLDHALEHLEKTHYLMATYLQRFPSHLAGSEFTIQMEENSDFLEDWGLGQNHPDDDSNPMSEGSILGEVIRRESSD